jgi:hypothetical protein
LDGLDSAFCGKVLSFLTVYFADDGCLFTSVIQQVKGLAPKRPLIVSNDGAGQAVNRAELKLVRQFVSEHRSKKKKKIFFKKKKKNKINIFFSNFFFFKKKKKKIKNRGITGAATPIANGHYALRPDVTGILHINPPRYKHRGFTAAWYRQKKTGPSIAWTAASCWGLRLILNCDLNSLNVICPFTVQKSSLCVPRILLKRKDR